jgi:hypothetical protein
MNNIVNEIDDDEDAVKALKDVAKDETQADVKDYDRAVQEALNSLAKHPSNFLHKDKIGEYSPKFKKILDRITELHGTSLVYSQFRRVEGLGILGLTLQANGYSEFKIKKVKDEWDVDFDEDDFHKPKYIVFTGNNEETQVLLKIFNSDIDNIPVKIREKLVALSADGSGNNIRGSIIKCLMITQSGAEGISLKNVRQVHVVEPYWNYIRIDQVVGRAVRTCSHVDLPVDDRNVMVYIYNMVFTEAQLAGSFTIRSQDKSLTSDEYIYKIAQKKATIIKMLLDTVKNASIDCSLNAKSHGGMKCFSFPVNLKESEYTYALDINDEMFDDQYKKDVEVNEWKGSVLITKKGNFLVRPDTNEVYDYDLYLESGKLVKIGVLRIVDEKKQIVKS